MTAHRGPAASEKGDERENDRVGSIDRGPGKKEDAARRSRTSTVDA